MSKSFCSQCVASITAALKVPKPIWTYDLLFDTITWNDEPLQQIVDCPGCGESILRLVAVRDAYFTGKSVLPAETELWKTYLRGYGKWPFFSRTRLDKDQERILNKRRREISVLCVSDAKRVNELTFDPSAKLQYDVFRDAVHWSDEGYEAVCDTCRDHIGCVLMARQRYLDMKRPLPALLRIWETFQSRHPRWPGFQRLLLSDEQRKNIEELRAAGAEDLFKQLNP